MVCDSLSILTIERVLALFLLLLGSCGSGSLLALLVIEHGSRGDLGKFISVEFDTDPSTQGATDGTSCWDD